MSRRRPAAPEPGLVAWGYYAVTPAPHAPIVGGSVPGLVQRQPEGRCFWAAWWTTDPRRDDAAPDDYGFVEGAAATIAGEAITVADRRVREAMGPRVFAVSVGEPLARRAYREGAPQRRVDTTDFGAIGAGWLAERGLPPTAIEPVIRKAWRDFLKEHHPDHAIAEGLDLEAEKRRYEAALAGARARASSQKRDEQRADIAAGKRPLAPDDRPAIKKAKSIAREVRVRLEILCRHVRGPDGLAGFCHFAALGLVEALRDEGLRAVLASEGGHSFVHVLLDGADEPLLLDITASQFGLGPVYVRLPGQPRRWMHDARVKGSRVRGALQELADVHLLGAPPRWWAIPAEHLPAMLEQCRTRLATEEEQRAVLEQQAQALTPEKIAEMRATWGPAPRTRVETKKRGRRPAARTEA